MAPLPISAVIITLNEADNIGKCIDALVDLCDEIIIIDSGSTDHTLDIARSKKVIIIETKWKGFGPTKNIGHKVAKNDWIFSVDSDEVVTSTLDMAIRNIDLSIKNNIYQTNRLSYYNGQWIRHSGWYPNWAQRIFHKDYAQWSHDKIHEKLLFSDGTDLICLEGDLEHYSYKSTQDHIQRIEKYARLKAELWFDNNNPPSFWKRHFGPFFKFFKTYYLKQGYKDGEAGKEIAELGRHGVKRQIEFYDELVKKS